MKQGNIVIHLLIPETGLNEKSLAILTEAERLRASRFRNPDDTHRWVSFRSQVRTILGRALDLDPSEVALTLSENGKPLLEAPHNHLHFILSHTENLALLALSEDGPVGIDLEPLSRARDLLDCESTFCHPEEIARLPIQPDLRARMLLEIWTSKEAVLKALGTGLMHPPELLIVEPARVGNSTPSHRDLPGIENQSVRPLDESRFTNYRAVVSSPRSATTIEIL
jgi:4'-phosphopantetheinyl transferase